MGSFAEEIKRLEQIAASPPKIAALAASQIATAVDREFAQGSDPYGDAWAALSESTTSKGRFPPPLNDAGAMKGSTAVNVEGTSVRVSVEEPANFHQSGTGAMPARPILPADGAALPDPWNAAYEAAAKRILPKGAVT